MYDTIVIGSGPAGSRAAKLLSEKGKKILMLERGKKGKDKACAGVISPIVLKELPNLPNNVVERKIGGIKMLTNEKECVINGNAGVTVKRKVFDQWLRDEAEKERVEVKYEEPVTQILFKNSEVRVKTSKGEYTATNIIGAFGYNPALYKFFNLEPPKSVLSIAYYVKSTTNNIDTEIGNNLEVHYKPQYTFCNYAWSFPYKSTYNVGLAGALKVSKNLKIRLDAFIKHIKMQDKENQIIGAMIPMIPVKKVCDRKWILIGDAGGFMNPLVGEGISYGFKTAQLAMETIIYDPLDLRSFENRCQPIYAKIKHLLITNMIISNPKYTKRLRNTLIDLFQKDGAWAAKFLELFENGFSIRLLKPKLFPFIQKFGFKNTINLVKDYYYMIQKVSKTNPHELGLIFEDLIQQQTNYFSSNEQIIS